MASVGFFESSHTLLLKDGTKIENKKDYLKLIELEKQKIFTKPEMKAIFDDIESLLKNAKTKKLRDILTSNPWMVTLIDQEHTLEKNFWLSNLNSLRELIFDFCTMLESNKILLEQLEKKANETRTKWQEVI